MIQSYKQKVELSENYDAIIIGSGMGSLTTAALLSKEGKKVLVLERHYTAGGFTHVFKRKGYEWDVGIHYIGEVQNPNTPIRKMFDYVSNNQLKWADMGEVYDKIVIGDKTYDFVKGVKNFKSKMHEYFPNDVKAINDYVQLVFDSNKSMKKFYLDKSLPNFLSNFLGFFLRKEYLKFSSRTTYEVISSLTENKDLIKVLTGQYGDYGLPPKQSSFAMHASVVKHYFNGGSFPVGGSSQIAKTIDKVIESSKGTILTKAEVSSIIIENNTAKGVVMSDGKKFYSDLIISGTGVFHTYNNLINEKIRIKHGFDKNLTKVTPSVAHGCLYIGLNGTSEELKLPKSNLWIYPKDLDHDSAVSRYLKDNDSEFPLVYISFASSKDPSWQSRYPNKSTIDVITLLPYERFLKWEGTSWMKRGEDYEKLKVKITNRLLDHLYDQLPHLKGKIDCCELSSPLTTKNFVNYNKGELYGIDHTPTRFSQKFLRPKTPIKGLYLTGQDIVSAGVGGALFSGLITASAITKVNFMKKIYK
ncbi:NAD(P)/FAD-dependent oxidoreductase [Flavobacteriaceae bacterium]|jgi:all-trans-retinol 13,14-reductase|nr:NAD(P)/FAD-dependent oxidoreductase [Flavobacteriaceae bacterium]|tara:strand:- start:673 stop:2259 length:1587 start_codon:yes stop_codon:yes gene_type:complete